MKFRSAFALAFLVAASSAARADSDSQPTAIGFWELQNDDGKPKAWFLFTEKDDVYSGRLVKAFKQPGEDKPPQTICAKCPGDKKGAHIMGLTLFYNMKRDGLQYREGSVLDPRDGSIYHAQMDLSDDGQELSVRGYIGIPMLGKTQVWHRLPDDAMKTEDIPKEILANSEDASGDKAKPGDKTKAAAKPKHGQSIATEKSKSHKPKADKPKPDNSEADSQNADPGSGSQ